MSSWSSAQQSHTRRRQRDRHVMFVVQYRDGSRGFARVPPEVALYGAGSLVVLRHAAEEQRRGVLQAGAIERLIQVR